MGQPVIFNAADPEERTNALEKAAEIVREGGIVAYPTESFYGLAVDPSNEKAVERLFQLKQRPKHSPILLLISEEGLIKEYAAEIPENARVLIQTVWPGRLTLVFKAKQDISPSITGGTGKIGLRISSNEFATSLARGAGGAITGTSANISSHAACLSAEDVLEQLGNGLDAILDGGRTPGGAGTTVLDVSEDPLRIIREGMVSAAEIRKILGESFLQAL